VAWRSISDLTDIAYYLSNAPIDTPLLKLAQIASSRYVVEQVIEEGKGETGLDEYEVRCWHSWHRHITLSMMAHAWLVSICCKAVEKRELQTQGWLN
jgi:SRSO17 transposase